MLEDCCPRQLHEILDVHAEFFQPGLGCCTTIKAELKLQNGAIPKSFKPRKLPFAFKKKVGLELDRLTNEGEKVSSSQWASPIVVVNIPEGNIRICADFKVSLNPVLVNDVYPLLIPEELFHKLNGGCKFTKVDLAEAYLQVELTEESSQLVVINTHQGLYRYKRLPFGLSCAPATFQKVIEQTVGDIRGVACYLDDIVVTGKTEQEHVQNLQNAGSFEIYWVQIMGGEVQVFRAKCGVFRSHHFKRWYSTSLI